MGSFALSRRRLAVAISSVALSVAGGVVLPSTAAAAPVVPWTTATAITGTDVTASVQDVVTAADGSAVAVWNQFAGASGNERRLHAAVRPAGSDAWGTPALLATTPTEAGSVKVHVSADGTVTAVWWEFPNSTAPYDGHNESRLVSSVLAADRSGWSTPVALVGADASRGDGGLDLAEAADGTLTAVWGSKASSAAKWEVSTATRGADGAWSAPVRVSTATADGADLASAPSVAVTSDGATVVVYKQTAGESAQLRAVSRAADAAEWSTPVAASGAYQSVSAPEIAAADDGSVTLAWKGTDASEDSALLTATRAADGAWSAAGSVTATENLAETPEPLIAPDGDVTLVWVDYTTTFGARTATRDADTGVWSAVRTLSTAYVPEQYDTAIGDDGTVHALWTQGSGGRVLMESVRSDGVWSTAAPLPGSADAFVRGRISVGDDGAATAVWSGTASGNDVDRLYASRTAWPALAVSGSAVPAAAPLKGTATTGTAWAPTWQLSRPTSAWTVTLTDRAGRTVRALSGSADGLKVAASWNGRTASGSYAPNGPLTWTLHATQDGASSAVRLASGTVTVTDGAALAHDFGGASATPDGTGDLLTLSSSGGLTYQYGTGAGTFSGKLTGTGWATSAKAVPVGDLSGDRCNDVLVRLAGGALRLYKPACGAALKPTTSYTTLATSGWNQYDVLTSPGDVTKDGRPDVIARNSSTGTVYLYKGTSTGRLAARVKLYADWKTYKKVVGAGDLNGDGAGDLLAQDKADNLYRYLGTGKGTFGARVKVAANWGGTYNAVVGVGDLNRDGKADLVARDTAGKLYRQYGDGKGSFGTRTLLGTGWGGYKSLS